MKEIVSVHWLNKNLNNPNLIILDASIKSTALGIQTESSEFTIPKARRFDLKNVFLDTSSPFPNTIPTPEHFEAECQKLGINQDSEIVVFDNIGVYSSPRVWWLFHIMGHQKIAVLDGGLPYWIQLNFPTERKQAKNYEKGNIKVDFDSNMVIGFDQIKRNTSDKQFVIVDARSEGRFNGIAEEPRKHLKSGHIPNSINIPYKSVLRDGRFKSEKELKEKFSKKYKGENDWVFSCGSGMTACIVMLASQMGHMGSKKIYDGSWTEWAELNNLKTEL